MPTFSNAPSLLITPTQPVYSRHFYTSSQFYIPPLHTTGILSLSLIFLMTSQLHEPTLSLFYSLVRPCTVNKQQPCFCRPSQICIVLSKSSNILILQVTGTFSPFFKEWHSLNISSGWFNRNEPQLPLRAMPYGQPKLISTA